MPRGKFYWRVRAVDGALNEGPWSSAFELKSGILPLWAIASLVVLGVILAGSSTFAVVYHRRGRRTRAVAFPDLVREVSFEPALTAPRPTAAPALRPAPRLALPVPSRRKRSLSPEEQAGLNLVLDFMFSLPLLQVSSDLAWLDDLVESSGSASADVYEQVLEGQIELRYQPGWVRHPTYEEVMRRLEGHSFPQSLRDYVEAVDDITADTVSLLRQVYGDVAAALPPETLRVYEWPFVLAVAQNTLAWFRGTYLREPSARDYVLVGVSGSAEESLVSLHGEEATPFPGPIVEGVDELDAVAYRDLHIQLRANYTNSQSARLLAARMASLDVVRGQLTRNIEELRQKLYGP